MMDRDESVRRRWNARLSLRTLMILTLLVAGGLGWFIRRVKIRREAVAAIEAAGGSVVYDFQRPAPGTSRPPQQGRAFSWLVHHLGVDFVASPVEVSTGQNPHLFDDAIMARVGGLERIEELSLRSPFSPITDAGLAHVARLKRLKRLTILSGDRVTDDSLAYLTGLHDLESLVLNGIPITSEGLRHLKGLRKLKRLVTHSSRINDLRPIADLSGLEILSVYNAPVDDDGVAPLVRHPGLLHLDLTQTRITDAALDDLATIPRLGGLVLSNTRVTDVGLTRLAGHRWLGSLWLNGTKVTDAGLIRLSRLPNAKLIQLYGAGVSAFGVEAAKLGHPSLRIEPGPEDFPPLSTARRWRMQLEWTILGPPFPPVRSGPVLVAAPGGPLPTPVAPVSASVLPRLSIEAVPPPASP